ncbi:MAG: PhnD/SsuA/transferrin family substrate-binding protein [Gammaproteobacteria bacterium]|jgi:ABC-type phosphate/phosphonate transport system substrate-binding protein
MDKQNTRILFSLLWICLFASFTSSVLAAELILTAPPRENAQKGNAMYGPIAEELSKALGQKVIYQQPKNWADYANKMRDGYYDIVFDGPHFVAWRQKNLKHLPVVSLPGSLAFYIVTHKNNKEINNKRDLIGRKICGFPSPHLATDLVYGIFDNPVIQPDIYEVRGGQRNSFQAFKDGKCEATIFRTALYKVLPDEIRNTLKIVAETKSLPNQTISVSQRLHKQANVIADTLLSKNGLMSADKLLSRYSKRKKQFIRADPEKFTDAANILEGRVWGW